MIYMPEIRKVILACEIYALFYPETQAGQEIKVWMDRYAETITSSQFLPVFEKAYIILKKVFKGFIDTFYNRVRYDTMNSNKLKLENAYDFI